VVCDAGPCQVAVFEDYSGGSVSTSTPTESPTSGPTTEPTGEPTTEPTAEPTPVRRRLLQSSSESSEEEESSESCDWSAQPDIAAIIINECQPVDDSESIMITCTSTHDAMVSFFTNDHEHECIGSATATQTSSEFFNDHCSAMVACNVIAGDDSTETNSASSESEESEESDESGESGEAAPIANCNHAVVDGGVMVADVCQPDGDSSRKLICEGGEGYLREWALDTNCEGEHEFSQALSEWDVEAVCDAGPCPIVVFEVHASDDDESDSTTMEPAQEMRRLQESSHNDSSCDYDSAPRIQPVILDTCVEVEETESMIFTCVGTHDAMVQHFLNDPNHDCSGTATTTTVAELQENYCVTMIACNVFAGESPYTPTPTTAPTEHDGALASNGTIFATLLIAVALLFNA